MRIFQIDFAELYPILRALNIQSPVLNPSFHPLTLNNRQELKFRIEFAVYRNTPSNNILQIKGFECE